MRCAAPTDVATAVLVIIHVASVDSSPFVHLVGLSMNQAFSVAAVRFVC